MKKDAVPFRQEELPRIVFIALVSLTVGLLFAIPELWSFALGPLHYGDPALYPFLDMHGRLAAFEGHRAGINVLYEPNPFDPMGRTSVKPSWPLALSFLGLGSQHLIAVGSATVAAFLAWILLIVRPGRMVEAIVALVLCLSPGILLGMERANDDLVYFSLLCFVPILLAKPGEDRAWLAWLIVFMLAPAKYYPGAVFLAFFFATNDRALLIKLLVAGAVFVAGYAYFNWQEILYLKDAAPSPNLTFVNGFSLAFGPYGPAAWALPSVFALISIAFCLVIFFPGIPGIGCDERNQHWFLFGMSVYTFCFFLNSNFDYRFIFLLPCLPLLFELIRDGRSRLIAGVSASMLLVLGVVFWCDRITLFLLPMEIGKAEIYDIILPVTSAKNMLLLGYMVLALPLAGWVLRPRLRSLLGVSG